MFSYPVLMRSISAGVGGAPSAARAGSTAEEEKAAAAVTRAVEMTEPVREKRSRREEAAAAWMAVEEGGEMVDGGYTLEAVNAATLDAIAAARTTTMAMI